MQGRVSKWNDFSNSNMKTPTPPHPIKIQWKNRITYTPVRAQATKRSCSSCPSMTTPVAEAEEEEEEEEVAIHRANFELLQTLQITHCDEWKSGRVEAGQP
jgi:hypothetical protein